MRWFAFAGAFAYAAPAAIVLTLVWVIATAPEYAGQLNYIAYSLALLGLAATIPTLLAAVVSGTLADRMERRRLMRITNAAAIVAALGVVVDLLARPGGSLAVPGPSGYFLPTWMLLLLPCWATLTAATTLFRPAYNASLPALLPTSELGSANGLIFALSIGISVVGSLLATALLNVDGAQSEVSALVPLALLLTAQFCLSGVSTNSPARHAERPTSFLHDARRGYSYLWERKELLEITITALAINFLSTAAFVELGLYVTNTLGVSNAILYGGMVTGSSIGVAIGSLLMGRLHFERRAGLALALVTAGEGVSVLILGFSRSILVSLPDMVLFGVFPGMYMTVFLATIQATVPSDVLGRVLAADEVGSYAMVPVGQYVGGILTVALGSAQTPFVVAGIGTILVGLVMATFRRLRSLGFEPVRDRLPTAVEPVPPTPTVPGESIP